MKLAQEFWLLAILVIVPACIALWRRAARLKRASLDRVIAPRLHEELLRSVDYAKRRRKFVLFLAALVLLVIALARPLHGFKEIKVERPGVDVILALDISRSMMADDAFWRETPTNRLAAAKASINRMVDQMSGDRVGLLIFAGEPFLMAPVTQDHNSVLRTLGAVSTTAISKPGSDIAAAIRLALKSFAEKEEIGKAIVIISDGEELQGDAIAAARAAGTAGVSIFTVGAGSASGAKVPDRSPGPLRVLKNEFGQEIRSRLNERVLQQVAMSGHGFYAPLGASGEGLLDVSDRGLRPLARGSHTRISKDQNEYFQIPLAVCLVMFAWEFLVNERKKVQKATAA